VNITLTTIGRRSGELRTIPLYAFADGGRLVIVGSRGGSAIDPAWASNLRANPRASFKRGRHTHEARADEVGPGPERDRLWELVCEAFPLYGSYQRRTKRLIPLFVLEPIDEG